MAVVPSEVGIDRAIAMSAGRMAGASAMRPVGHPAAVSGDNSGALVSDESFSPFNIPARAGLRKRGLLKGNF